MKKIMKLKDARTNSIPKEYLALETLDSRFPSSPISGFGREAAVEASAVTGAAATAATGAAATT